MSNDLVSLDDIIKKSKPGAAMRNRGGPRQTVVKSKPKVNGTVSSRPKTSIEDARFKIIQKKRKHIGDAREKLAQIAKQSDARLKLEKLRATTTKKDLASISRKTGRNGRISLTTNKPPPPVHIPRSMPPAFIPPPVRTLSYRPPPPISEPQYMNAMLRTYANEYLMNHQAPPPMRRTVSNDYAPSLPPPPPVFNIKPTPYRDWDKPPLHSTSSSVSRSQSLRSSDHSRPRDYKVIPRTDMTKVQSTPIYKDEWNFSSKSRTIIPDVNSKYYQTVKSHRDVGVRSRLQASPPPPTKTSRSAPTATRLKTSSQSGGYRIVVSNLQSNVTQEDIKELFEDVGELLVSRLVRPGIAEVIYKTLKDASKAVETYHNRQLDGHPMKCLLVNPRPKGSSSSSSSSRTLSHSRSSSSYGQASLGAVHRALFDH
ncbi:polymerase delta-interacting protein 3-like [Phymastichus coffea]|uniref:polymerase delta-interacting protein 3-like n=1 Tax=Phymastichus coffea TaxID=108790 RepID=UPI00273B5246|nr:polymerase delta-interacting protein 3-like [Phymastichus coffea]